MAFWDRLQYFMRNTNLHGLKYVADEKRPLLIRLIWIAIFVLSFYAMILIFQASFEAYQENSISFVTETAYLNWNTTFPAVTLCEIAGAEIDWNEDESQEELEPILLDLIFFTGSCYGCDSEFCSVCDKLNFTKIVNKYRKKCSQLLSKCKWNNQEFDCCKDFLPLETEYGVCYSFNSLHTSSLIKIPGISCFHPNSWQIIHCELKISKAPLDLDFALHAKLPSLLQCKCAPKPAKSNHYYYANRKTGPASLYIETLEDVRFYFHAQEDVPFINLEADHRKDVMLGETYNISINVIEIENDENVDGLAIEKRACRFPDEKPDDLIVHKYYSYSTCVVQCHADAHLQLCNCTHHLMPVLNRGPYCDIDGLKCLTDNYETVNRLHANGYDKPGLVCDCLPSCTEPEYTVVASAKSVKSPNGEIFIKMQSLPTSRFKRIVVRTTMDLVVSIGGTAGLFIGASILSLVETVYLFFLSREEIE